ncbi:ABC transporter permease [Spirosoma litoris]
MSKPLPNPTSPPRWADHLLNWVTPAELLEELQGDLHEQFAQRVDQVGSRRARWWYGLEALKVIRPYYLRRRVAGLSHWRRGFFLKQPASTRPFFIVKQPSIPLMNSDMIRNYLKIAWRNLTKYKGYSAINISGLAIGMAVAITIGLWVWDELSFNKYYDNYDRIVQVAQHGTTNGETWTGSNLPYPLGAKLQTQYPSDFKRVLKAWHIQDHSLTVGADQFSLTGLFIESGAPDMLALHMLKGTRAALTEPNSILVSASAAKVLFGETDPMNKVVKINNAMDAKVTGVYEDMPANTEFHQVQFFAPWDLYVSANPWIKQQDWGNNFIQVWAELQPHVDVDQVSAKIRDIKVKHLGDNKELLAYHFQIFLHPMSKWHLYSGFDKQGNNTGGQIQYVWLFSIIGGFVLLLASINFMNLSTARSEKRAKEVGIRKAVGSVRGQLIGQFFSESFLVVLLSFILAIFLVALWLGWFNELADKQMVILWTNPYFWLLGFGFMLMTGLLAGSYPALYLSSFQPLNVLKGTFRVGRLASVPRKVLVVVQFTVSVTLIIGTLIVYRQIQHAKNRPVGYSREGLIQVRMASNDFYTKYDVLRQELLHTGVVLETAQSASQATELWSNNSGFDWPGKAPSQQSDFGTLTVSPEYGKTVGWQFVAGRDFSRDFATDSATFVVNQAAARFMGLQHPIGETIRWHGTPYRIIGVIQDMVMGSPFDPVYPTVFFLRGPLNWINIKLKPSVATSDALPKLETVFKKVIPSVPFDYDFVDQQYAAKFAEEERVGKLAAAFASLAIFISCLGLFGLASFVAEQRTKEIGVRKVLGASLFTLWHLLTKDFVLLVGIAFAIAMPTAWYLLTGWIQKYSYRTEISWWIFAAVGSGSLLITLLTVSYQLLKAALINPVKSLRSD